MSIGDQRGIGGTNPAAAPDAAADKSAHGAGLL
jgi:hypothetical protein